MVYRKKNPTKNNELRVVDCCFNARFDVGKEDKKKGKQEKFLYLLFIYVCLSIILKYLLCIYTYTDNNTFFVS